MSSTQLSRICEDFRLLSARFEEYGRRAEKPKHLAIDIKEAAIRAGRLLVAAIDAGGFPKSRMKRNQEWWDRARGRVPGYFFTVLGYVRWHEGQPSPFCAPEYLAAVTQPYQPEQFLRCWQHAVGTWLARRFPSEFRHGAERCDSFLEARDEAGRLVGKDGKPLRRRWYRNGKPLRRAPKSLRPGDRCALDGEPARQWDFYDNADALARHRVRAEVYADACRVLASLLERNRSTGRIGSVGAPSKLRRPTIRVAGDDCSVSVDGELFTLRSNSYGHFIRKLLARRGSAVKCKVIERETGSRCDRIYAKLPKPIQTLISKPGRGQTGYTLP